MSVPALQASPDGVFQFATVHEHQVQRRDSEAAPSSHSSGEGDDDSETESSKMESSDSKEQFQCCLRLCSRDGACAIFTGTPLERELRHRNIVSGSKVLMVVIVALFVLEALIALLLWISAHHLWDVLVKFGKIRTWSHFIVQATTMGSLVFTCKRPRLVVYLPTITFWILYNAIFWLFLPLREMQPFAGNMHFYSRDATGYIALHGNMWLMFLLPLLVPECRFMSCISRCWIGLFFVIMCVTIALEPNPNIDTAKRVKYRYNFDLTVGVLFLGAGFLIASGRKRVMEEEQLAIFRLDEQKKGVSENMFNILGCMVPSFLLVPMLKDPDRTKPIAYNVDRASVLFIMFDGFDQMVRGGTMSPHQLLIFLNRYFTQIDNICASYNVTKIETVGHEYVAAVGVVPDDRVKDRTQGHQSILGQLVLVAKEVMELQNQPQSEEPVTFQMGIHTGPVVAGVVGQRLPRFRLFGDTINTAARMMQKGLPGEVQFGEATKKELPRWVVFEERGQVEMKGKGQMTVYLLRSGQRSSPSPPSGLASAADPMALRAYNSAGAPAANTLRDLEQPDILRSRSLPVGDNRFIRRGLTQMLFEVEERGDADWHCTLPELSHPQAEPSHSNQSGTTETLSFDDILEALAMGAVGEQPESVPRFKSASRLVWSTRFRSKDEATFRHWFHETCFCKNLVRRMRRLAKAFIGLSIIEVLYLFCNIPKTTPAFWSAAEELWVFLACRFVSISIILAWLAMVASCDWVQREAKLTQRSMLTCWLVIIALVFLSYNSLPFMFERVPLTMDQGAFPLLGISRNIVFLDCFPVIMVMMMVHPFTFVQACSYPVLMAVLVFVVENVDGTEPTHVLNNALVKVIFLVSSMVCTAFAYLQEANLRDRHRAQCTVNHALRNVEGILGTLMPPMVLKRIRHEGGEARVQHHYSHATVVQSDLVGFTQLASTRDPRDVVKIISELFGVYDNLADKHGVYKVETVGDAYIGAQAEEPLSATNSPLGVVLFGLEVIQATHRWARNSGEHVSCRVGVHTGECVGGVVGSDMQRYHLFGNIMTVLDLLESTAPAGKVQVSTTCKRAVDRERLKEQEAGSRVLRDVTFLPRNQEQLSTSKGELHSIAEVGGPTFLVCRANSRLDPEAAQ